MEGAAEESSPRPPQSLVRELCRRLEDEFDVPDAPVEESPRGAGASVHLHHEVDARDAVGPLDHGREVDPIRILSVFVQGPQASMRGLAFVLLLWPAQDASRLIEQLNDDNITVRER